MNNLQIITVAQDGRYHSPYSDYSTSVLGKLQAHLLNRHGEQWERQGPILVRQPVTAVAQPAAEPDEEE